MALEVKNLPVSAGETRDAGLIPGSGRSPGVGNGNPLQYSCLENPMDKGACQTTLHEAAKNTQSDIKHWHIFLKHKKGFIIIAFGC